MKRTVAWNLLLSVALLTSSMAWAAEGPGPGRFGPRGEPPRMPVMAAIDTNGDGEVSAEELAAAAQGLKKLDRNGDGKLSADELRPQFRGGQEGRMRMGPPGGAPTGAPISTPQAKDDAEAKILKTLMDIEQKQGRRLNVPQIDGRMLRLLAEASGAKTVVEVGTSNGISAIWMGLALRKTGGKIITHEIDPEAAALARKNFAAAGMEKLITVVEGDAHETIKRLQGPIDLVFIDAEKEGYPDYLQKLLPLVRPGGLILAHNINARMANAAYVQAVSNDPNLETLLFSDGGGLSVSLKKR